MKRLVIIIACAVALVSGCAQVPTNGSPANGSPGYSGSATEKMLESPAKAQEAAQAASEKAQRAEQEMKELEELEGMP